MSLLVIAQLLDESPETAEVLQEAPSEHAEDVAEAAEDEAEDLFVPGAANELTLSCINFGSVSRALAKATRKATLRFGKRNLMFRLISRSTKSILRFVPAFSTKD